MLLFILGFIDLVGAIFVLLSLAKIQIEISVGIIVAVFLTLKGIYSLITKSHFASVIDLASAVVLFLAYSSIYIHYTITLIVGILLFIKSMQSLIPQLLG